MCEKENEEGVLEVVLLSGTAHVPQRANPLDAGYDLFASRGCVIEPWERMKVETDISITVPYGTYGRVAPRSGLAFKQGIHVGAGVVDRGYQGPVGIVLFNLSDKPFTVNVGDRIAQLILEKIATNVKIKILEAPNPDSTLLGARGASGFGASGQNKLTNSTTSPPIAIMTKK
jgi:dUTP pyrophosphatase